MSGATGAPSRPKAFFPELVGAFAYPFKGKGLWMLGALAVFMVAVDFVSLFVAIIGLFIRLFIAGYLCAYMLKVILSSAGGEDEPPDWPDFGKWWDDILHPILMLAGTLAACFLPAAAYYLVNISADSTGEETFAGSIPVLFLLLGIGSFFLPVGMLSVAMHDSFRGLNPLRLVRCIAKVPGPYTVAWAVLVLVAVFQGVVSSYLGGIFIISSLLSASVGLYFLLVEMRIIGLIYAAYSRRLNWFDEASDRRGKPRM